MKKISAIITVFAMLLSFAACSNTAGTDPAPESSSVPEESVVSESDPVVSEPAPVGTDISFGVLKGPTGIGAVYLMGENENGNTVNSYDFTVAGAADELTGRLISGDLDIAALPTQAVANLSIKTQGEIQMLGVNTLGVLYVLEKGDSISTVGDLEGKTVLASGKGSTAETVLSYILEKNGVNAEIYWASEHTEAATLALSGDYDIVMLPEPFVTSVTMKDSSFRVALDLTAEWEKLGAGVLPMGCIAVRRTFADENPEALRTFIREYGISVGFANENVDEAAKLCEKHGIIAEAVAKSAIPRCNMVWEYDETEQGYKATVMNFLGVVLETNPDSIEGVNFHSF